MILKGPDKDYALDITLALIAAIEADYVSLYRLADELLDKTLPVTEMLAVLTMLYRHAGCEAGDDALGAFLLTRASAAMLEDFLVAVLGPLEGVQDDDDQNATLHALLQEMDQV